MHRYDKLTEDEVKDETHSVELSPFQVIRTQEIDIDSIRRNYCSNSRYIHETIECRSILRSKKDDKWLVPYAGNLNMFTARKGVLEYIRPINM